MRRRGFTLIELSVVVAIISIPAVMPVTPAWADAGRIGDSEEPEVTVVVTAERAEQPASESIATTTVITARQIREQGAQTVTEALRVVPGVTVKQNGEMGSLAVASLRGASASQVLVLVDGHRVSSAAFLGGTDLSKFSVADIERIEVIHGPVSSLYGSEAIGGVINIITQRPTGKGGAAALGWGRSGRAERTLSVRSGGPIVAEFTASFPRFSGTRPNSAYSATDLSGRCIFPEFRGWEVSLRAEDYRDSLGLPGADLQHVGFADLDDHQAWRRRSVNVDAIKKLARAQVEWRLYTVRQQLDNSAPTVDFVTGNPTVFHSLVTGRTSAAEATYRLDFPRHHLVLGGEYRQDTYRDVETQDASPLGGQNTGVSNRALYAQDRWAVGAATDVVVGARLDDHSRVGSAWSPRVGVNRLVAKGLRARASCGEGFRAPSLVELYYDAFGFHGNPNLKPERSRQFEVGMNWQRARDSVDLAVFQNDVRDQIAWEGLTWQNIERARQRGFEVAWERPLSASTRLSLAYSHVDARDRATGKRILRIPKNQVALAVAGVARAWEIALAGRWGDERLDAGGFDSVTFAPIIVTMPSRAVFDLTLRSRGAERANPYVVIRNLTNKSYEDVAGYQAEGRSIEVGASAGW